jgi:competence protein ComEA
MATRRQGLFLMICLMALVACQQTAPIVIVPPPTPAPTVAPTPAPVRVYVSGAVKNPGVYSLPPRSLVDDALKAAGGATSDADLERTNLAQEVRDQQQIHVLRKGEPAQAQPTSAISTGAAATPGSQRININTATLAELDTLPEIGPVTAQRIIDYRTKNGPFKRTEDLKNVSGIGDATFEAVKDLITVEP